MASWYPKWFNSWFKNWFSKSGPTTPVEPPITPTSPPIVPRAPADSPSILSGIRENLEHEFKLNKDDEPICVEFEDPEDIPKITNPELGCRPTGGVPDPPYPYPRCRFVFPKKIKVIWGQSGNGKAVVANPDKIGIAGYLGPNQFENPIYYTAYETSVNESGNYSDPMLEFSLNGYVESLVIGTNSHTIYSPWWGSSQTGLPGATTPINYDDPLRTARFLAMDLYTLDEMKKGKLYRTETIRRAYCQGPPGLGGGLNGQPLPNLVGPEILTSNIEYQEVTVGHIVPFCIPVLDNEVNSLPTLRLRFQFSRHVYTSSAGEDVSAINGGASFGHNPYSAAIQLVSGNGNYANNIGGIPGENAALGALGWPGTGFSVIEVNVVRGQSLVSVVGSVLHPGSSLGEPTSFQFHLTW